MRINTSFLENLSNVIGCKCFFVRSISSSTDQLLLGSDLALAYHCDHEFQAASIASVLACVGSLPPSGCIFPRLILFDPVLFPRVIVVSWVSGVHLSSSQVDEAYPVVDANCSLLSACTVPVSDLRNVFELFSSLIFDTLSDVDFFGSYLKTFSCFPPCLSPCFVHGDLSPQNMLSLSGSVRFGLIDWEYAGYAYRDFDLGWYLAVCSFIGCQDLPVIDHDFPNLDYFICFGYLRLAARIVRRRASCDLLRMLPGVSIPDTSIHQQQLDLIKGRLLEMRL